MDIQQVLGFSGLERLSRGWQSQKWRASSATKHWDSGLSCPSPQKNKYIARQRHQNPTLFKATQRRCWLGLNNPKLGAQLLLGCGTQGTSASERRAGCKDFSGENIIKQSFKEVVTKPPSGMRGNSLKVRISTGSHLFSATTFTHCITN